MDHEQAREQAHTYARDSFERFYTPRPEDVAEEPGSGWAVRLWLICFFGAAYFGLRWALG